jgi:hypothetical protein
MIKPDYYQDKNGKDLLDHLADILPEAQFRGFCKGNAVKYITRYETKNGVEDLDKAITYLERLKAFEGQQVAIPASGGAVGDANKTIAEADRLIERVNAGDLKGNGIEPEIKNLTGQDHITAGRWRKGMRWG